MIRYVVYFNASISSQDGVSVGMQNLLTRRPSQPVIDDDAPRTDNSKVLNHSRGCSISPGLSG